MLSSIVVGSALMVATTLVHALTMMLTLHALQLTHAERWFARSRWTKAGVVAVVVLAMFFASIVETSLWAAVYLAADAIQGMEPALYFSAVTYATLGYGDMVLGEDWRLLATFEALNGIVMMGWTTALIFAVVHIVYLRRD